MAENRIILRPKAGTTPDLPGTLVLPDANHQVPMGSGVITSLISTGGMAIVYEIWNPDLEVKRAIKLLHPDHTKESEERFQTEMKITAKLHHPNIVEIYAVGKWNGLPYIEMERIDGCTIEKLIGEYGGLPLAVCTSIGLMVGRALEYAHNQTYVIYGREYRGIIHRDLKPSNIMATMKGTVKLMDFGIAKPMTATIHTCEGTVVGTMQYLAPEQLDGKEINARADIYSLGTVMYEMLTGVRAFPESNLARLVPDKLSNTFVPLEDFAVKIPAPLCNLVHKCMRHEPEKRIQNTMELLRSLDRVHRSITNQSPEQVMAAFMLAAHTRTSVLVKKRLRLLPAAIWGLTALALVGTLTLSVRQLAVGSKQRATSPGAPPVLPAAQPRSTLANSGSATALTQADIPRPDTVHTVPPKATDAPSTRKAAFPPRAAVSGPVSSAKPRSSVAAEATAREVSRSTPAPASRGNEPGVPPALRELTIKYQTADLMSILEGEVEKSNFSRALVVYGALPRDQAQSKRATLFRLRALKGDRRDSELRAFLLSSDVNDAEFFLEKAVVLFGRGDIGSSREQLRRAASSACELGDAPAIRKTVLYYGALCASADFDARPGPDTRKGAMEAWFSVKSALRASPSHEYYTKADSEIRRINAHPAPNG